ncbi:hypothetical protein O3G_MSEX010649 [Manduca sexta]|uniref:Uncharacterized protein n=1 Tax=Manduca sexta TaxID=7130 RepID=A0A921ZJZ9_MANSE|nr:hypothetical protein O3G_MSEX010649 [Manduca sexta]
MFVPYRYIISVGSECVAVPLFRPVLIAFTTPLVHRRCAAAVRTVPVFFHKWCDLIVPSTPFACSSLYNRALNDLISCSDKSYNCAFLLRSVYAIIRAKIY